MTESIEAILKNYLDEHGRITEWPGKKKRHVQRAMLEYLRAQFEPGIVYTEKQVNEILQRFHTFDDWAMLRREMFEQGLLNREKDGSAYWVTPRTKLY